MNLPYQAFIALRYLRSKKRHKGVSVNTAISIGGVAVGVMALLVVLSVMSGFQQDLQKKILGANAHIVIRNIRSMEDMGRVTGILKEDKDVAAFAPFVIGQVMVSHEKRAHGVYLRGIEPADEVKTTQLLSHLREGSIKQLYPEGGVPGIILGKEL